MRNGFVPDECIAKSTMVGDAPERLHAVEPSPPENDGSGESSAGEGRRGSHGPLASLRAAAEVRHQVPLDRTDALSNERINPESGRPRR